MLELFKTSKNAKGPVKQLELQLQRKPEKDRNFDKGGRSFYFFDFDDNIAILSTPTVIFHKSTGKELKLSSREFAENSGQIGKMGIYRDYEVRFDDDRGSFRFFRDHDLNLVEKIMGRKQLFIRDLEEALGLPEQQWKGPSWQCFYHAVFNKRPLSLITARGHHPETIKGGIRRMISEGHLPHEPNYLSLYPVNFPDVKNIFLKKASSVAEMKQLAIRSSVEKAFEVYGYNPFHRFGMSDDDPKNVQLIIEEMSRLKKDYPEISFFVFDTHKGQFLKREVYESYTKDSELSSKEQLRLF